VQLPGIVNIGSTLSWMALEKMARLRIGLSAEVFPDWDTQRSIVESGQ
jgi:hypothetical protein